MPRELFSASVVGVSSAARRGRVLPVSIALHGVVLGTLFVLPLMADSALPLAQPRLVFARVVPPPSVPAMPAGPGHSSQSHPAPRADAAPTLEGGMPEDRPDDGEPPGGGPAAGVPGGVVGGTELIAIEPPPTADPRRVGGVIRQPTKIHDLQPVYPAIAQSAHVEGWVILEAVIDERGRVSETRVLKHVPLLDEAAETAVRQWVYSPTLLNGQAIAVVMTVTVQFHLQK
jgi:periplasmic protein TonB